MATILDQVDDQSHCDFHMFAKLYPLPEYVKTADTEQVCNPQGLPSNAYGDVRTRKFPCHTKAATLVSCLFFIEKCAEIHPKIAGWIGKRLDMYADHWGIRPDVVALKEKHASLHADSTAGLPDSAFAWVMAGGGQKERRYPLRNTMEVKAAAHWLGQYRDQLYYADRQRIAQKILDKAAQFGAGVGEDLEDMLEKIAGRGVYDPGKVAQMLRDRVKVGHKVKPAVAEGMLKLASEIETNPMLAEDLPSSIQLCTTVDQFDREHGVVGKYAKAIPRPEDVIFGGTLKAAEDFVKNACCMVTGSIYDRDQFGSLSPTAVREVLGSEIAQAVTTGLRIDPEKMAEVASTLPVPDAQTLDRLMLEAGQPPFRKDATARGVTEDDAEKLAKTYAFLQKLPPPRDGVTTAEPTGVTGSRLIGA